jgi:hypothetical protein
LNTSNLKCRFVFGGYIGKSEKNTNELLQFDTTDNSWKQIERIGNPPAERSGHCLHTYKDFLWVVRGVLLC